MESCSVISNCMACGSEDLTLFFDLGQQPLANAYRKNEFDSEERYPLAVNSCNNCRHVQLTHSVDPRLMFSDYAYVTGVSKTTREFFEWFSNMSIQACAKPPLSVLDVGCNDGSQLDVYKELGLETYGIDPAKNICEIASKKHNIVCDFFKDNPFNKQFDIVIIQNAFAHNSNQYEMLNNLKKCTADDGLIFIATSQADMLINGEFDTIYHEHISFYNTKSMKMLAERCGLFLIDVQRHSIHGGSYIFVLSRNNTPNQRVDEAILSEEQNGAYSTQSLQNFKMKAYELSANFFRLINDKRQQGYKIAGYSSPAKGQTFLNYAGVKLDLIIDDTPFKQGKYTPGMSIPVYGQEAFELLEGENVVFVVLAWNFYDEIMNKIKSKRSNSNDLFITYFQKND